MIFVECKPDKALIRALNIKAKVRHHEGKDTLCNKLRKETGLHGMVDEDPHGPQNPYFKELTLADSDHDIKKFRDESRNNALIVLCPDLEGWILKTVKVAGTTMRNFALPYNQDELHDLFTERPEKIEKLIQELFPKSPALKTLKKFLEG